MLKALVFAVFALAEGAHSYVHTRSSANGNVNVRWGNPSSLSLSYDDDNSYGFSSTELSDEYSAVISSWNTPSQTNIGISTPLGSVAGNKNTYSGNSSNEIYFSTNPLYFSGSGVLAVTEVTFYQSSGIVVEADILVNDNRINYALQAGGGSYLSEPDLNPINLRDVLTHEMGHFLGLGHSQVKESSMIFVVFRGQETPSSDDIAGLDTAYGASGWGQISGKIVGGTNTSKVGIFGAHVHAISKDTGKVAASTFSNEDGTFTIGGLQKGQDYIIYTAPLKTSASPPSFFSSARSNFCVGGGNYRGSFFQSCGKKGEPQTINLSGASAIQNIGEVTIRCDLRLEDNYLSNQSSSANDLAIDQLGDGSSLGANFVGKLGVSSSVPTDSDEYSVDLTQYNVPNNTNYFLELRVISQEIFSKLRIDLTSLSGHSIIESLDRGDFDSAGGNDVVIDSDSNPWSSGLYRIQLDQGLSNTVDFSVDAKNFYSNIIHGRFQNLSWFFPAGGFFVDENSLYLLTARVVQWNGVGVAGKDGAYTVINRHIGGTSDNSSCVDSQTAQSQSVSGSASGSSSLATNTIQVETSSALCGSVDLDPPDPPIQGGPLSLTLGFMLITLLSFIRRRLPFRD